ncbi:CrcB family protein [Sporolactobacillus sp. THM7-4]|nr:CrcB family protein [Sporolactobacillus sp. THM7-4]
MTYFWVLFGGFFGAIARFTLSFIMNVNGKLKNGFPLATFLINGIGSFILGLLAGLAVRQTWQLFLGVGFAGAFTTFSTMNLESVLLFLNRKYSVSAGYVLGSYAAGTALAFLGIYLGRSWA